VEKLFTSNRGAFKDDTSNRGAFKDNIQDVQSEYGAFQMKILWITVFLLKNYG
jgi:hypothetical protein